MQLDPGALLLPQILHQMFLPQAIHDSCTGVFWEMCLCTHICVCVL